MNFRYIGEPGRTWPAVPVTPDVGDVVAFDVEPDARSWEPTDEPVTRQPDNAGVTADGSGPAFMQPKTEKPRRKRTRKNVAPAPVVVAVAPVDEQADENADEGQAASDSSHVEPPAVV